MSRVLEVPTNTTDKVSVPFIQLLERCCRLLPRVNSPREGRVIAPNGSWNITRSGHLSQKVSNFPVFVFSIIREGYWITSRPMASSAVIGVQVKSKFADDQREHGHLGYDTRIPSTLRIRCMLLPKDNIQCWRYFWSRRNHG